MKFTKIKKFILTSVVVGGVAAGSLQVYAATVLDTNAVKAVKDGVDKIEIFYKAQNNSDLVTLRAEYKSKVDKYINDKATYAVEDVDNYSKSELERANKELDDYLKQIQSEADNSVQDELNVVKGHLKDGVDASIATSKKEMVDNFGNKLSNAIDEKLNEKENNGNHYGQLK